MHLDVCVCLQVAASLLLWSTLVDNSDVGDASYLQVYQTARRGLVLFQHAHYWMLDSLQRIVLFQHV